MSDVDTGKILAAIERVATAQVDQNTRLSRLEHDVRSIKAREAKRDERVDDARRSASDLEVSHGDFQRATMSAFGNLATRFEALEAAELARAKAEEERAKAESASAAQAKAAADAQAQREREIAEAADKGARRTKVLLQVGGPVAAASVLQVIRGLKDLGFWDWLGHALHVLGG